MAIIACIVGAPISIFANTLITMVLAVETSSPINAIHEDKSALKRDLNNGIDRISARKSSIDGGNRRQSSVTDRRSRGSVTSLSVGFAVLNPLSLLYANTDELGTTFNEDLSNFMDRLLTYRNTMIPKNSTALTEFDELWGINTATGHIRSDSDTISWWDNILGKEKDVHQLVLSDLNAVRTKAAKELEYLNQMQLSDTERGQRLMRLFQQDLLPGLTGDIIESTEKEVSRASPSVPIWAKITAWCALAGLNAGMLFYIYLFAMNETSVQQDAWFKSFILWIVMDAFICATITVYIKNIVIPSYAMSDLRKIRSKIVETVKDGLMKMNMSEANGALSTDSAMNGFNSADFFFVSSRVASHFPDLRESKIILHYSTPWPKQSYQRKSTVSSSYVDNTAAFTKSLGMVASFILSNFVTFPVSLQNFCLQSTITTTIGYIFVGATLLYKISILLLFGFIIALLVTVHYIVKWNAANAMEDKSDSLLNKSINKILPMNTIATVSGTLGDYTPHIIEEGHSMAIMSLIDSGSENQEWNDDDDLNERVKSNQRSNDILEDPSDISSDTAKDPPVKSTLQKHNNQKQKKHRTMTYDAKEEYSSDDHSFNRLSAVLTPNAPIQLSHTSSVDDLSIRSIYTDEILTLIGKRSNDNSSKFSFSLPSYQSQDSYPVEEIAGEEEEEEMKYKDCYESSYSIPSYRSEGTENTIPSDRNEQKKQLNIHNVHNKKNNIYAGEPLRSISASRESRNIHSAAMVDSAPVRSNYQSTSSSDNNNNRDTTTGTGNYSY